MVNMFSFKDLEKVRLKALQKMKIGGREIYPGQTILVFDKIQIANIQEIVSRVSANGGFHNTGRVFWDTPEKLQLSFTQGVFSKQQFGFILNSNMIGPTSRPIFYITQEEILESNQECKFKLKYTPNKDLFIYNKNSGQRIFDYTVDGKEVTISDKFVDVIVTYSYEYNNVDMEYLIGQNLLNGFVELEGRTRIKDDTTGNIVTGILKIPHLRIMSGLSIRLGSQATPFVGNFIAQGIPIGSKGNTYISEFYILGDDIENDL